MRDDAWRALDDKWCMIRVRWWMIHERLYMMNGGDLVWLCCSETSRIWIHKNLVDCCDISMTCVQTNALGDAFCENVLQILDICLPKPRYWRGPDQLLSARTRGNYQAAGQIWMTEPLCWSQNCDDSKGCLQKLASCIRTWQVPSNSDLWKGPRKPGTYTSRGWILEDKTRFYCAGHGGENRTDN